MKIFKGKLELGKLGPGVWRLLTEDGESFDLMGGPEKKFKDGRKAKIKGRIRKDMMGIGMGGPILEVEDFEEVD